MPSVRAHDVRLDDGSLTLRPMTDVDWPLLLRWNNDPDVLFFAEGGDVTSRTLAEVQELYCSVCERAYCFIIEHDGVAVGECWLQRMNLPRILARLPEQDLRRIDIMIGEKALWGRGIGTRVIRLLVHFAFEVERADAVFACDISNENLRSLRAFQKNGFTLWAEVYESRDGAAAPRHDLWIAQNEFRADE